MKIKFNDEAFVRLRTSGAVYSMLERLAQDAVRDLSEGGRVEVYSYSLRYGYKNRAAATIVGKGHARNSNEVHGSLVRELDNITGNLGTPRGRR